MAGVQNVGFVLGLSLANPLRAFQHEGKIVTPPCYQKRRTGPRSHACHLG